jgi:hypothetical protein
MLDWAITQAPVNIALLDTQMRQLRLNASLCRSLGLDDEAAGLGLRMTDLLSNPATESCVAAAGMVARTGRPAVWRGVNQMPGQLRDHAMDVDLSPVKDPAGRVCGVLVVAVDVTEQHLARQRLALLNEASTRIGCTLDMTRTAEELVEVAVPGLADFATIDLLDSVFRGDEPTSSPFAFNVPLRRMACGSVLDGSPEALVRPGQVSYYSEHSPSAPRMTSGLLLNQPDLQRNLDRWAERDRSHRPVRFPLPHGGAGARPGRDARHRGVRPAPAAGAFPGRRSRPGRGDRRPGCRVHRQRPPLYPRACDRADLAAQPAPAAPAEAGSGPRGDPLPAVGLS